MSSSTPPPFAGQRMICLALVIGMTMYAIAAGVVLQTNDGAGLMPEPIEVLDTIAIALGVAMGVSAYLLRRMLRQKAADRPQSERGTPMFLSRLIPLAMLEGACLFAITAWMLNGKAVPALAVACVLLSIAIAFVPFADDTPMDDGSAPQ